MSRPLAMIAVVLAGLAMAAPASAKNLFTLDDDPIAPARVAQDGAGTAYVGWVHDAAIDQPRFCKVPAGGACTSPVTLPIPNLVDATDEVSGVFPVLGPGATVYVVAPRYVNDDVVIWTSTDGGASFGPGEEREDGYTNMTNPSTVLLSGDNFLISADNPGLGFGVTPLLPFAGGDLVFASPGDGSVVGSGLAATGTSLVEAYWLLSSPPYQVRFYRYKGAGALDSEASWEGPFTVTSGYETELAGGPAGIFLASQDYAGGSYPSALNVRRFDGANFGAPTTLASDDSVNLFASGAIAQSAGGSHVAVAWPMRRGSDYVMRLFVSTNAGATWAQKDVALIGNAYALHDNAQLSIGDDGRGWLSWRDASGVHVADLTAIEGLPQPIEAKKPPRYKGPTRAFKKRVGNFELTLRLPKRCLQQQQPFFAGVGVRARGKLKKKLRGKIRVLKVTFKFDGRRLSTKKKKPFRQLVRPGPLAPGSVHRVVARVKVKVTRKGRSKKVVRVLRGTVKIC